MVLQPHSDLESSPCELSSENRPQVHYGSEYLETNREDDPKEIAGNDETQKGKIGNRRRYHFLAICLSIVVLIAVVLSSSLTQLLKRRRSVVHTLVVYARTWRVVDCSIRNFTNLLYSASPGASPQNSSALMTEVDLGSPSKYGAFNGTAISIIDRRELDDAYHLFYQHHDGRLKHLVSSNPRTENWTESQDSHTLASNARNRTSLTTVVDGHSLYLFYVDQNNHIQQVVYSNGSNTWQPGFKNPADNETSNTLLVALRAEQHPAEDLVFTLYYGSNDGLVHEILWGSTYSREIKAFEKSSGCNGVVTEKASLIRRYVFTVDSELLQIQFWTNTTYPDSDDLWTQGKSTKRCSDLVQFEFIAGLLTYDHQNCIQ